MAQHVSLVSVPQPAAARKPTYAGGMQDEPDPRIARTRAAVLTAGARLLVAEGIDSVQHTRVSEEAGVGRRTMYRHWPDRAALLHDVLANASFPSASVTGDLRRDLVAHLRELRSALNDGPLRYIILALNERAAVDPALAPLRDRLTESGCRPLRELLDAARRRGDLPRRLDLTAAAARLEGPLFYRSIVLDERIPRDEPTRLVTAFLANP
jgi:AcrR family transcriptional regulator